MSATAYLHYDAGASPITGTSAHTVLAAPPPDIDDTDVSDEWRVAHTGLLLNDTGLPTSITIALLANGNVIHSTTFGSIGADVNARALRADWELLVTSATEAQVFCTATLSGAGEIGPNSRQRSTLEVDQPFDVTNLGVTPIVLDIQITLSSSDVDHVYTPVRTRIHKVEPTLSSGASGGGAPDDAAYLTTTAHGSLTSEVVVGTTPGGELGGTWASPTVDATHSGSSHASVQAAAEATAAAALASVTSVDFLVGTASGALSGEIPVGATPGGELGGTWAAPTVDATHSGTSHAGIITTHNTDAAAHPVQLNTRTADYTVVLGDAGKTLEMNTAGTGTFTVPTNAVVAFPVGTRIRFRQIGAGITVVTGALGVTFQPLSFFVTNQRYGFIELEKVATDTWYGTPTSAVGQLVAGTGITLVTAGQNTTVAQDDFTHVRGLEKVVARSGSKTIQNTIAETSLWNGTPYAVPANTLVAFDSIIIEGDFTYRNNTGGGADVNFMVDVNTIEAVNAGSSGNLFANVAFSRFSWFRYVGTFETIGPSANLRSYLEVSIGPAQNTTDATHREEVLVKNTLMGSANTTVNLTFDPRMILDNATATHQVIVGELKVRRRNAP